MASDAIVMGLYLNDVLDAEEDTAQITYMVELKYWDFLGVQLMAKHYSQMKLDRKLQYDDRNKPSLFLDEPTNIEQRLRAQRVRFVVLQDQQLIRRVRTIASLQELGFLGRWGLFRVTPVLEPTTDTVVVDFSFSGHEVGSDANPFNTLQEGVDNVSEDGEIRIRDGISGKALVINKKVKLTAEGGIVTIGQ